MPAPGGRPALARLVLLSSPLGPCLVAVFVGEEGLDRGRPVVSSRPFSRWHESNHR
ncbi:hypothetical protein ACFPRL_16045 [Pseudoclavibacter helvolus]